MAYEAFYEGVLPGETTDSNHVLATPATPVNVNADSRFTGVVEVQHKDSRTVLKAAHVASAPSNLNDGTFIEQNCVRRYTLAAGEALWIWGSNRFSVIGVS